MNPKFGIITISHKRPKVLELFCASIQRLRITFGNFPVVCVGDKEHKGICDTYNIHHIEQQNNPASFKWNTAVKYILTQDIDYVMVLGSDDVVSNDVIGKIQNAMNDDYDFIYTHQIYFYSNDFGGRLLFLNAKQIIGICRTVHRRVLENLEDFWWPKAANSGMDGMFYKKMKGYIKTTKTFSGVIVDVKTRESLNKFAMWNRKIKTESDLNIFYNILSEKEKQILKGI